MFLIKIAGVPIAIANRYSTVLRLCRKYIIYGEKPAFTVRASDKMLLDEYNNILSFRKDLSGPERDLLQNVLRLEKPPVDEQDWSDNRSFAYDKLAIPLRGWCYLEELSIYRQICYQFIRFDAFVLHSAVIAINGEGVAFVGKHGAGKSTRVNLWKKDFKDSLVVVNGDKPIIRLIEDTLYACGTPWNGKENLDCNCMVPLKTLFFVERGPQVKIQRLHTVEISQRIFEHLLIPENGKDLNRLIGLINILIEQIPCYLLNCSIEAGEDPIKIWNQIRRENRNAGEMIV